MNNTWSNLAWYTKTLIVIIIIALLAVATGAAMGITLQEAVAFLKGTPSYGEGKRISREVATAEKKYILYFEDGTTINLEGKEWSSSTTTATVIPVEVDARFITSYDSQLVAEGWTRGVMQIAGKKFYPPALDVPYVRMWGYTKVEGDNFYVTALRQSIKPTLSTKPNSTTTIASAPYTYTYTVFVADPISVSYLLQD